MSVRFMVTFGMGFPINRFAINFPIGLLIVACLTTVITPWSFFLCMISLTPTELDARATSAKASSVGSDDPIITFFLLSSRLTSKKNFMRARERLCPEYTAPHLIKIFIKFEEKFKCSLLFHNLLVHGCIIGALPRVCFK